MVPTDSIKTIIGIYRNTESPNKGTITINLFIVIVRKGQKRPLSLFPLTFKKCKMSKRNGAVGKETVDLTAAEPAEAGGVH